MNVPQLRFNGFSGEWEEVSLGKLGDFTKGMALSKADISEEGDPCILYGELYTKYGPVINQVKSRTNSNQSKRVLGTKNDVLIPSSGETAIDIACASALEAEDILLGGDLNIFRPKENVSGAFLSYQINGVRKFELSKLAQGASVVHLYSNSLKNFKVKLPTFEEQQKIALFFKFLDKKIEKQQVKIKQLEQLKKGMMQKIFSQELRFKDDDGGEFGEWEEKKLSQVLKIKHGRDQKKIETPDGKFPILATGGTIGRTDTFIYDKESVLIGRKGTIDRPVYMDSPFWTVDTLFYSEIKEKNYPRFIFYTFQNINWKFYNEASGVPSLSAKTIEAIKIMAPTFEEQQLIADYLAVIDKKIEKEKEKLMVLGEQKKGFMQGMFV